MGRGIGFPLTRISGLHGGGKAPFTYTPAESAVLLPQTSVWISQQGVTVATGVSSWVSYLGGLACTLSQATGGLQPAYSAAGGVGGRPLITTDGVDDVMKGTTPAKGSNYSTFEMGVVGARVAGVAGDAILTYEVAGSVYWMMRDASAAALHGTDAALYNLATTTDPDANNKFYTFNGGPSLGEVRVNGTIEAANTTTCTVGVDNRDVAFGARTASAAYANWAVQGLVFGVQLTDTQRTYLRGALTFHTGIAC